MKYFFAAALTVVFAAALPAQVLGTGALGGPYLSRGIARPLGGIGPTSTFRFGEAGRGGRGGARRNSGAFAFPYAYSVYVPSYFDALSDAGYYPPVSVPGPPPVAGAPNPPVIINQYFGAPPEPGQGPAPVDQNGNPVYPSAPQPPPAGASTVQPGDTLSPAQNYYLIAYKDHSVYAALAYWVEDNTLHYVTTQNTHNQASLNLIDLDETRTLNQNRNVPFSIPGK